MGIFPSGLISINFRKSFSGLFSISTGCNFCFLVSFEFVDINGVKIVGFTDLPSRLPSQSSELYANNVYHVLNDITPDKDGKISINMEDEVIRSLTIIKEGQITFPPPKVDVSV